MAFPSHSSNNTQRLLGERDKIEDEIARLEMKLHQRKGSPGFRDDMEMVDSLKRILVALRNEHKVIMETLDHAISAIGTPEPSKRRRESFPPERAPLESLVRKVQIAVSSENDDSILAGHITPVKNQLYSDGEMSMSTYKYLCKYNLLNDAATLATPRSPLTQSNKILDEELIKRMPKL